MLKRINESLPGLIVGILLYGMVLQLTVIWFVEDKLGYSIGLWYGIVIAMGMAMHMALVIYDVVTFDGDERTQTRIAAKAMLRYVIVVILFGILAYFHPEKLIAAFCGIMGLKISAHLQPLFMKVAVHKTMHKAIGDENGKILDKEGMK